MTINQHTNQSEAVLSGLFAVIARIISTLRFLNHQIKRFILNTLRKPLQLQKVLKKVREFTCVVYY